MADRKKAMKKRAKEKGGDNVPTKEQKSVATFLRFNCPTKSTTCAGEEVHYFTASKAIDCLLESKYATGKTPVFTTRSQATNYCQALLDKGLFWHARKLVPRVKERDGDKKKKDKDIKESQQAGDTDAAAGTPKKTRKRKDNKEEKDKDEKEEEEKEDDKKKEDEDKDKSSSKKKPKKIKLEFHEDQSFKDGTDVYVWHFDPVSWTKFLIGLGLVIGSVLLCLFPLWPHWLRLGVYYLSLVAMGLVGFLLFLIVLRGIIFGAIWVCSFGKHHFWLLPNLTEDCGVLESFKPAYSYAYYPADGESTDKKSSSKSKKSTKDKQSDAEEGEEEEEESGNESEEKDVQDEQNTDTDRQGSTDAEQTDNIDKQAGGDYSSSERDSSAAGTPLRQRTNKKSKQQQSKEQAEDTNGFEIVD